jgi:hypothetical protein
MSQFQRPIPVRGDDVSGHAFTPDEEDTEGHRARSTDAEATEQDTEGHRMRADAESVEGEEDTEGHGRFSADAEQAEDDDVEGHIYVNESSPQGGRMGG